MRIVAIPSPYYVRRSGAECPKCGRVFGLLKRFYGDDDFRNLFGSIYACATKGCNHLEQRDGDGMSCTLIIPNEEPKKVIDDSENMQIG